MVREPGSSKPRIEKRPQEEWVYLPEGAVPPILVTEDGTPDIALFERVQKRLEENKQTSTRNNQNPYNFLLRGGYIKCGYCGGNMSSGTTSHQRKAYHCHTAQNCGRCTSQNEGGKFRMLAHTVDSIAWEYALEIIRDPSIVESKVEALKTVDPNAERREYILSELAMVKGKQSRLRDRMEDEDLDDDTYTDIKRRLAELANLKKGYESELKKEINIHDEWKKTQEQLNHFNKRCQQMLIQLNDPTYEVDYEFKREVIEFLGIIVRVWRSDHNPRFEIELNVPSIVSSTTYA